MSHDRLIFNMGIPIPEKDGLYIEKGPWFAYYMGLNSCTVHPRRYAHGTYFVVLCCGMVLVYCKTSNIWCTKSQDLNVSYFALQLSLPNPLKPGVKSRMKLWLEQGRQAMLQLHLNEQQFLPEASFGHRVLSLPASVCVCVRARASTLSLSAR